MKKGVWIFFLLFSINCFAQSDRLVDSNGNFKYQYNRTLTKGTSDPSKMLVTFIFVNGNSPIAISYRQETFKSTLSWEETGNGNTANEKSIETITANLAPQEQIIWKFTYRNKIRNRDKTIDLEKAALMLMNESYEISKTIFKEEKMKL
ncbi:MAG: hypothetical protein RR356_03710 [Bacteroidales bacterium]